MTLDEIYARDAEADAFVEQRMREEAVSRMRVSLLWEPRTVVTFGRVDLAPRMNVVFACPQPGCTITVPMFTEATEIPLMWDCIRHRATARRMDPVPLITEAPQPDRPFTAGTTRHDKPNRVEQTPRVRLHERPPEVELIASAEDHLAKLRGRADRVRTGARASAPETRKQP
ncbi:MULTISPECIES: hypothetical protein [unclassified Crossiella]|uniref:hypothetical protein n=1 Tax=unclassified Crossiella TaxID=2620835 RepID=UPI001FFF9FF6|nr:MULTISPECIES: hypothetical protein [unclassified Crossiella]MCK2240078.1 hypothetical protein [Crossiella sp. S99.2]MCK2252787.1 hypothetical protein [Crossiella sp. S99.1]